MRRTFDRSFYVPKDYADKVTKEGVKAEVYLIDNDNGPVAMGFAGRRSKYDFYVRFRSEESRAEFVEKYFAKLARRAAEKAERQAKVKGFEHTLKKGDVLYSSWGYDQTNIDFYEVVEVVGKKSVKIQKINSAIQHRGDSGADYVVAASGRFSEDSEPMLKRVREGNSITLTSYSSAHPWDGRELYETSPGWGH